MQKFAIIIGINDTNGLPYLPSPCNYARRMAQWAEEQGFITKLFTDEPGDGQKMDITVELIRQAGQEALAANPKQLLIYFAGHGLELEPGNDIWLLPKYAEWPHQAINITKNKDVLFKSGADHIIFISDACRSPRDNGMQRNVLGSEIFPSLHRTNYDVVVDVLYSTWPGEASIDYRAEGNYVSAYSECLLDCLHGTVENVIRNIDIGEGDREEIISAVISRDLSRYLKENVPRMILTKTGKRQQPNSNVNSDEPIYISKIDKNEEGEETKIVYETEIGDPFEHSGAFSTVSDKLDYIRALPGNHHLAEEIDRNIRLIETAIRDIASEENLPMDSTGLIIHGNSDPRIYRLSYYNRFSDVMVKPTALKGKSMDQINLLDIPRNYRWNMNILVGNNDGSAYNPITILPGFVNSLVYDRGKLISIDYFPTMNNRRYQAINFFGDIAARKATIITAASNGIFQGSREMADYLRIYKSLDPILGLFAAYAYYQNGRYEEVHSVLRYMEREREQALGEVKMLAMLSRPGYVRTRNTPSVLPMLTQGWSYLNTWQGSIPNRLKHYLRPGLWTSFDSRAFDGVEKYLRRIR